MGRARGGTGEKKKALTFGSTSVSHALLTSAPPTARLASKILLMASTTLTEGRGDTLECDPVRRRMAKLKEAKPM